MPQHEGWKNCWFPSAWHNSKHAIHRTMNTVFLILLWDFLHPPPLPRPQHRLPWLLGQSGHGWECGCHQVSVRWLFGMRWTGLEYHTTQGHLRPGCSTCISPVWAGADLCSYKQSTLCSWSVQNALHQGMGFLIWIFDRTSLFLSPDESSGLE